MILTNEIQSLDSSLHFMHEFDACLKPDDDGETGLSPFTMAQMCTTLEHTYRSPRHGNKNNPLDELNLPQIFRSATPSSRWLHV